MSLPQIDSAGWLRSATYCPSPNFGPRPVFGDLRLIVVHAISLPPCDYGHQFIQRFFANELDRSLHPYFDQIAHLKVSAHCLIERDGTLTQFVSFHDRAWHAGASCWKGERECNDFSIGIELEGCDQDLFSEIQYDRLAELILSLQQTYPTLEPDALCGHSDIAPGRKTDPGPGFDWALLNHKLTTC